MFPFLHPNSFRDSRMYNLTHKLHQICQLISSITSPLKKFKFQLKILTNKFLFNKINISLTMLLHPIMSNNNSLIIQPANFRTANNSHLELQLALSTVLSHSKIFKFNKMDLQWIKALLKYSRQISQLKGLKAPRKWCKRI